MSHYSKASHSFCFIKYYIFKSTFAYLRKDNLCCLKMAVERAQSVKCLQCKHEDPHKELRMVVCIGHLSAGERMSDKSLKFAGQSIYLNQLSLGPVRDLISENKVV